MLRAMLGAMDPASRAAALEEIGAAASSSAAPNDEAVVAAALALRASNPMIYQLWLVSSASVAHNQAAPIPPLQGMGRYQITHAQFNRLRDRLPEM